MLPALLQTVGPWFLVAAALAFLATAVEQAAAPRSPEDDHARTPLDRLCWLASLITIALLLWRGATASVDGAPTLRIWLIGLPVVAAIGGALLGSVVGAVVRLASRPATLTAMGLSVCALAAALAASMPQIQTLVTAAAG
jgi:hypothetical protein